MLDRKKRKAGDDGGTPDEGGDAEGLPGGRIPAPPIPRDEWIEQVVDDPAGNLRPVLLQGYVGKAAEEGYTRIYPDASLGTFVDVRDEDVLYHIPMEGEHSPRGGSMVWIRGDAQTTQGQSAGGGAAANFFTGPVLQQNRQGGAQAQGWPVTAGCTLWNFCRTQQNCPPALGAAAAPAQGGAFTRFPCSAVDACPSALGCTQVGCPPGPGGPGNPNFTRFPCSAIDACPSALACTLGGICEPGPVISVPQACSAVDNCPTAMCAAAAPQGGSFTRFPCSAVDACPSALGCTLSGCEPGGPGGGGNPNFTRFPCSAIDACPSALGCTQIGGCEPGGPGGPGNPNFTRFPCSAVDACPTRLCGGGGGGGGGGSPTTVYGPQCPSFGFTCTAFCQLQAPGQGQGQGGGQGLGAGQGGGEAAATLGLHCPTLGFTCTYVNCPPRGTLGFAPQPNTGLGCPRTRACPPTFQPGCGPDHEHGGSTAATLCTVVPFCPPTVHCLPPTLSGCRGGAQAGGLQGQAPSTAACQTLAAAAAPQGGIFRTYNLGCTLGFTCTYVGCPPVTIAVTSGLGCPGTSTCPPTAGFGCPQTIDCTPPTLNPGCPRTSTCPPTFEPGCGGGLQAAAAPQGAPGFPTGQYSPQCPTFGFTCTVFCQPQTGAPATSPIVCTVFPGCPPPTGPDSTIATICTQIGCPPTADFGCPRTSTCPPTFDPGCGGGLQAAAAPQGAAGIPTGQYSPQCPTFGFTCTYVNCPPVPGPITGGLGCPGTSTCPPTAGLGCPNSATCPPTIGLGCPGTSTCPPTAGLGCPSSSTCPPTADLGCPRTSTCPPTFDPGCGGTGEAGQSSTITCQTLAAAAAPQAAAGIPTGQYSPQCPTFGFTCTYVNCPPVPGPITGGLGCPGTSTCPPTAGFGCPNSATCPPTIGLGCPGTSTCPPTAGLGCPSSSTCPPTADPGCPRTSTCPPTFDPGCGGTGGLQAAAAPQGNTLNPGCTLGFTCTYVGCPGGAEAAGPRVSLGCPPPTIGCPWGPGGGQAAAVGPYTMYPGCPTFGFTCTQFC